MVNSEIDKLHAGSANINLSGKRQQKEGVLKHTHVLVSLVKGTVWDDILLSVVGNRKKTSKIHRYVKFYKEKYARPRLNRRPTFSRELSNILNLSDNCCKLKVKRSETHFFCKSCSEKPIVRCLAQSNSTKWIELY